MHILVSLISDRNIFIFERFDINVEFKELIHIPFSYDIPKFDFYAKNWNETLRCQTREYVINFLDPYTPNF